MWINDCMQEIPVYHYIKNIYEDEALCGYDTQYDYYLCDRVNRAYKCKECLKLLNQKLDKKITKKLEEIT